MIARVIGLGDLGEPEESVKFSIWAKKLVSRKAVKRRGLVGFLSALPKGFPRRNATNATERLPQALSRERKGTTFFFKGGQGYFRSALCVVHAVCTRKKCSATQKGGFCATERLCAVSSSLCASDISSGQLILLLAT